MSLVLIGGEIRSTPLNNNFQYLDGKHLYGDDAAKPAPGQIGRLYVALDTEVMYADTGAAWVPVGGGSVPLHASTHELGGSDEINLEDLPGESAELKTHKADGVHEALRVSTVGVGEKGLIIGKNVDHPNTFRYLLLGKLGESGADIEGRVFGSNNSTGSSIGQRIFDLRICIHHEFSGVAKTVSFEGKTSYNPSQLVKLVYQGSTWIAIDAVNTADGNALKQAYFTGTFDGEVNQLTWVKEDDVSNVEPMEQENINYFGGLTDRIIEESGSNANGEYVRWGNGLQMCWANVFIDLTTAGYTNVTGPALFQGTADDVSGGATWRSTSDTTVMKALGDTSLSAYANGWRVHHPTTYPGSWHTQLFAIGRWK